MFHLVDDVINPVALHTDYRSGAYVSFEGRVRRENEGKAVQQLEYRCYREMAEEEGRKIFQEASRLFSLQNSMGRHRIGLLQLGELALYICVSADHRAEAFQATMFLIDEIKKRLPIWKKEYYIDKSPSQWLRGETME